MKSRSKTTLRAASIITAIVLVAGTLSGIVTSTVRATPAHADTASSGGLFVPTTGRILDTLTGAGGYPVAAFSATWHSVGVEGVAGLPASGISAIEVSFTVVAAGADGGIHAYADGVTPPTGTITYCDFTGPTSGNVTNSAIIPLGTDGKIQVEPSTPVNIIIDVEGYYTSGATAAGGYVPVPVTAVANTATGTGGVPAALVPNGGIVTAHIGGVSPIPSTASSVVLDVSIANPTANGGTLGVYAAGTTASGGGLQWQGGHNEEWTTTVALPSSGGISVKVYSGGSVNIAIAVEGYFTAFSTSSGGAFTPLAARVFTSLSPEVPLASNGTTTVQVTGVNGVPAAGSGIAAVAVDITVLPGTSANGHMQVYADDASPGASEIDYYTTSEAVSGMVAVPLGADGGIKLQNSSPGNVDYVVDVEGWYQAPNLATPTISCPAPYSNGSAATSVPTSAVNCTVSVANQGYGPTNGYLDTYLDGTELAAAQFSNGTTTTQTVTVPAQGGAHSITTTANSSYGTEGSAASYGFTIPGPSVPTSFSVDPWITVPDPGDPDDPSATSFTPTLSATSNDAVAEVTTFEVRTAEDATAGSLVQTCVSPSVPAGDTASCQVQPLVAGTYYVRSQAVDGAFASSWSDWSVLPVSSTVSTEILAPAVITCPSISNGEWDLTPPTTSFDCEVTAPAAPSGTGSLYMSLDGNVLPTVPLDTSSSTTATITIPVGAAAHEIDVSDQEITDGPSTRSDIFTFGSGNWSDANLIPNIANGADSYDLSPTLWAVTDGAPFTSGTTVQYTLSSDSDGSGVLLTATASDQPLDTSSVTLTPGTTYYWQAVVQGPTNYDGTPASKTSPWWSFVATDETSAEIGTAPTTSELHADAASTTPIRCGAIDLLTLRGTSAPADFSSSNISGDGFTFKNSSQTATPDVHAGYGNTGNPGDPEYALVTALRKSNSHHIYTEAIDYPASSWFPDLYWDSVAAGRKALVGEMNNLAKECPATEVLISGHSQGAQAIAQEFGQHYKDSKDGLSAQAKANFLGAALAADPTYLPGEKIDAGGNGTLVGAFTKPADHIRAKYSLDGFRAMNQQTDKVVLNIRSYCKAGDEYCQHQEPNGGKIHNSYGDSTTVSRILAFFAEFE
jgi:hypothetical protein